VKEELGMGPLNVLGIAFGLTLSSVLPEGASDRVVQSPVVQATNEPTAVDRFIALSERVRVEPLKATSDQWYRALISGERRGGAMWFDVALHDPENPNTLQRNLADWILSARASLLLSYAKTVTGLGVRGPTRGMTDAQVRGMRAHEAMTRARIAQIVQDGGYAGAWARFVVAYRKWAAIAEKTIPSGDTAEDDTKTMDIVNRLGEEQGIPRLVRELPIDPTDIAGEILRLLEAFRLEHGLSTETSGQESNLLYVCSSGGATVHVHPWHRLANAFYGAWDAADKQIANFHQRLIMNAFESVIKDIHAWNALHPEADAAMRDRALNDMARTRGLYSLLEE
jgi:hypothetical protein